MLEDRDRVSYCFAKRLWMSGVRIEYSFSPRRRPGLTPRHSPVLVAIWTRVLWYYAFANYALYDFCNVAYNH